jgi:hypothetical protein
MYCFKNQQSRFSVKSSQGDYNVTPGEESCSTGIVSKLDIERDTEDVNSSPGGNSCSTGISGNAVRTQLSLIGNEQSLWEPGDRICHKKSPSQVGSIIKAVEGSTRYHVRWDVGSTSAVEGRNLTVIPVEQGDYRKLLTTDPDYLSEVDGQLTIFSEDEPPEPDDFENEAAYLRAWKRWELQYPQLAEAVRQAESELQIFGVEQKADIPVEQPSQAETIKVPKTRNTKPGRGSRPRQVKCNVTRNHSKSKSANTYWVYSFSFKVDGKYYDRSVSVPQEKVNQVIELWESKQYYWRDIVEFIGKNPERIIDNVRDK